MVHYIESNGTRYWINTKAAKNRSTGYYHAALVLNAVIGQLRKACYTVSKAKAGKVSLDEIDELLEQLGE